MMKNFLLFIIVILTFLNCKTNTISDLEKQELLEQLAYIKQIDQQYAGVPPQELKDKFGYEKAWEIFQSKRDSIALENQSKIKSMYKKYGFLGYDKVGKNASGNFWISIQHADNDVEFQKLILKAMKKEIRKNNASKSEFAMLEDRININLGKKQRFGTQLTYNNKGQAIPKNELIDSLNIDKLRKEYDLPVYKDYLNMMTNDFFEINREVMIQQGITKPKLYK